MTAFACKHCSKPNYYESRTSGRKREYCGDQCCTDFHNKARLVPGTERTVECGDCKAPFSYTSELGGRRRVYCDTCKPKKVAKERPPVLVTPFLERGNEPCDGARTRVCERTSCRLNTAYRERGPASHLCSMVVAADGALSLDEVGAIIGVSREAVRQIEERALRKLKVFRGLDV